MPAPRSYEQNCSLARSLDVLGERWTLLIVRELDRGPKRFRDLESALKGIGTNLLAARLKRLEATGVAERVEVAPGVAAYGLTGRGEELALALEGLVLWGVELTDPDDSALQTRAVWTLTALRTRMDRDPRAPVEGTYAFVVADERFWLRVAAGRSQLRDGAPPYPPDATLTAGLEDFLAVVTGRATLGQTAAQLDGDAARLRRLLRRLRPPRDGGPARA